MGALSLPALLASVLRAASLVATVLLHEGEHETGRGHGALGLDPMAVLALGALGLAVSTAVLYWALYRR